jgi:peroxiredoxin
MKRLLSLVIVLAGCDQPASNAPDQEKSAPQPSAPEASAPTPAAETPQEPAAPTDETAAESAQVAVVGKPAPGFSLTDLDGKTHELASYAGKTVVLEWFNPGCPFVKFAHTEGPLKDMAQKQVEQGVVWLAINSSGAGRQGHGTKTNVAAAKTFGIEHPILLDEGGTVGHRYGAEKTPHMYVIDEKGVLRYRGAIDNAPFGEVDGGGEHRNHVALALAQVRAGQDVEVSETPSYGCTVKYAGG